MPRYRDSEFELPGEEFIEKAVVKELELVDVLRILKEEERDAIFRIGEGGSVGSDAVLHEGRSGRHIHCVRMHQVRFTAGPGGRNRRV